MTTKRFVQGLMAAVALCLAAGAGRAQNSLVYLTVGGTSLRDATSFQEISVPYSTNYATGGGANVGFEMPLKKSQMFGLEFSYGFSQNNLRLTNDSDNPVVTKSYGLRDSRFSGDLVVHSPSAFHNARPYFVVGAEYDRYSPTSAATSLATTTGFAYYPTAKLTSEGYGGVNFGGGIDYKLTEKVGLRLDVRYHVTSSPTLGLPYGPTLTSPAWYPVSGHASNLEYTIGLVYHFGGAKAPSGETRSPQPPASSQPSPAKEKASAKKKSPAKEKPSPAPVM
jgi:opacity protein-like surface antigen